MAFIGVGVFYLSFPQPYTGTVGPYGASTGRSVGRLVISI